MRLGFVTKVLHDLNKRKKGIFSFFSQFIAKCIRFTMFLIYLVLVSICAKIAYVVNNF